MLSVDHHGSPKSTQAREGVAEAAQIILKWQADSKRPNQTWDTPVRHAYIHQIETGATHHYDMGNPSHVADLKKMAKG